MTVNFGDRVRRGEFSSGLDPNFFFFIAAIFKNDSCAYIMR